MDGVDKLRDLMESAEGLVGFGRQGGENRQDKRMLVVHDGRIMIPHVSLLAVFMRHCVFSFVIMNS